MKITYEKMDRVLTPHGPGTVAEVGPRAPWDYDSSYGAFNYVWVVLDAPYKPTLFLDEPSRWSLRGGWTEESLKPIITNVRDNPVVSF